MATKKTTWYVTATDKFLSGWGLAEGKIHKLIIPCSSIEQARKLVKNMKNDRTLKYINYTSRKPNYPFRSYTTKWLKVEDCPLWNK